MSELPPQKCRCGNLARAGRPTCGIVICLANDEYERAVRAEKAARLKPVSSRNPHIFHEERSELVSWARAIARRARSGTIPKPAAAATPTPIGRQAVARETMILGGKLVVVERHRQSEDNRAFVADLF